MGAEDTGIDVVAIGNAIVDVLAHAEDALVADLGVEKGAMVLVDAETSAGIYRRMGPAVEVSGGSAANTAAGVASLGGRAQFIGKVADDELGTFFTHDLRAAGVRFDVAPSTAAVPTARSLILVTPDAQRTMNTFLGVAADIGADDVDAGLLRAAAVTFVEGYLIGLPSFEAALEKAAGAANELALTLSDSFWVGLQREAFLRLLPRLQLVFANEAEACALYETDDVEQAVKVLVDAVPTSVITRSEKGSIVLHQGRRVDVAAHPVDRVVDTTGAGDLYAAGFLYGYTRGDDPERCARLGGAAAAEVISHVGARPQAQLSRFVAAAGL